MSGPWIGLELIEQVRGTRGRSHLVEYRHGVGYTGGATAGGGVAVLLCSNCQRGDLKRYQLPERARAGPRAPATVRHFCFVHIMKRRPLKRELVQRKDDTTVL